MGKFLTNSVVCWFFGLLSGVLLFSCSPRMPKDVLSVAEPAPLFPDYADGIHIPCNIAPLNFTLPDSVKRAFVQVRSSRAEKILKTRRVVSFSQKFWRQLTAAAKEGTTDTIRLDIAFCGASGVYHRFPTIRWVVCPDTIDPYLTYRLVQPIAGSYNVLELRQRCLENFDEKILMSNRQMGGNCFNCHTYCEGDADRMMIHLRKPSEGSLYFENGEVQKLRLTENPDALAYLPDSLRMPLGLVYAAWHPSGKYIAFCTNVLGISGYAAHRPYMNLLDSASNILLFHPRKRSVSLPPALWTADYEETWPAWSHDGKWLYFCRTAKVSPDTVQRYPHWGERVFHIRFDFCRIAFNPETGLFADTVQTLLKGEPDKSYSVPRVHPDGRHVLLCRGLFNSVPYYSGGDLLLTDVENLSDTANAAEMLNSPESESWHEWSANGRWVVFGSKRQDGHYTLPYFAYFDGKNFSKPFVLPQRSGRFYQTNLRAFNLPTFTRKASNITPKQAAQGKRAPAFEITVENVNSY